MLPLFKRILTILFIANPQAGIDYTIIESTAQRLVLRIDIVPGSEDDLKPIHLLIGTPTADYPDLDIRSEAKKNLPRNWSVPEGDGIRWLQNQRLQNLYVATLEIDPTADENHFFEQILITCRYTNVPAQQTTPNNRQTRLLKNRLVNWSIAKHWFQPNQHQKLQRSSLPAGQWLRFTVSSDGITALPASAISASGANLTEQNPRSFMVFTGSNMGRDRSSEITGAISYRSIPDNLVEIAVQFEGESDEVLDNEDQIIFYGRGSSGIDHKGLDISHHQNLYFTENTYWLLIPDDNTLQGKRVASIGPAMNTGVTMDYGISPFYIESDLINPFAGGLAWAGAAIINGSSHTAVTTMDSPNQLVDVNVTIGFLGNSSSIDAQANPAHLLEIYHGSRDVLQTSNSWTGLIKSDVSFSFSGNRLNDGVNVFIIDNESNSSYSQPHFDYLVGNYGRNLNDQGLPYEFFAPIHSNATTFRITAESELTIWDITNIAVPKAVTLSNDNLGYRFDVILPQDTLARYCAFTAVQLNLVSTATLIDNHSFSELRNNGPSVDHIVIGPADFSAVTAPLVTHRVSSRYVELGKIYDEFSGGNPDPVAIRDFIQWTQENWFEPKPYSVMLMGDADYDYRNITQQSSIQVPTIEIGYGFNHRAADDRLAAFNGLIPDIAIGRYPAKSVTDVAAFVDKIIQYETNPDYGLWRQRVTLVADDAARPEPVHGSIATGKSHTQNSETIAGLVAPSIEIRKLYMMEFPEVSNASLYGVVKPEATQALLDILTEGTAIINYIGHGSAHQWAQERLLYQDNDLNRIQTKNKLPLWIAGTCSWGHFDEIETEAFSEEVIRMENNGASAIISTSRLITVSSNAYFTREIFKSIFPNGTITNEPIGVIMQAVKDGSPSGELFHLFGDPGMPLALPHQIVSLTNISPDTLHTLDTGRVSGTQNIISGGSGLGFISLRDAERSVTREYIINSTEQELSYTLPGGTLFKGQFSFSGSAFSTLIRVPKDISYSDATGTINVYMVFEGDPAQEALGTFDNITLAGGNPVPDIVGPIISFENEIGRLIRSGDHFSENETLYLRLSDPLGINLTGEVGHEILITDLVTTVESDITHLFLYDENSITTGKISLGDLIKNKEVEIQVKAWDNANNPSELTIKLYITDDQGLRLFNVFNFPNPFALETQFSFEISSTAEVSVDIFTLGGRMVCQISPQTVTAGYNFINWDGRDKYGDILANGVYLYRIKAKNGNESISSIGKIAKYQ